MKQERVSKTKRSSKTTEQRDRTPATDRREIRKDVAKIWWPESV